jgi:hypothetical protein
MEAGRRYKEEGRREKEKGRRKNRGSKLKGSKRLSVFFLILKNKPDSVDL